MMSDYVFMIDQGKLVLKGELDEIKQQHQMLTVRFQTPRDELPALDGLLSAQRHGDVWSVVCNGKADQIHQLLRASGGEVTKSRSASLSEIFVARVGRDRLKTVEG